MCKKVSVIVPVYNVEPYISRCIDSIICQTYGNLELILVNDGSTDNSGDICDLYASRDSRIRVLHKVNGGLSEARNTGIDITSGDFITFVDSDDWLHEKCIEYLINMQNSNSADIAVCNFIRTSEKYIFDVEIDEKKPVEVYTNIEALYQLSSENYVQMVVAWGKLYKKEMFEHIRFPTGRVHEDEFVTYKLLYAATKIAVSSVPLLYYYQRENSIMGSAFNFKNRIDLLDAYEERSFFYGEISQNKLKEKTELVISRIYALILIELRKNKMKKELSLMNSRINLWLSKVLIGSRSSKYKLYFILYQNMPVLTYQLLNYYSAIKSLIRHKKFNKQ